MSVIDEPTGYETRVVSAAEQVDAGEKRSRRVYIAEEHVGIMTANERARLSDLDSKARYDEVKI